MYFQKEIGLFFLILVGCGLIILLCFFAGWLYVLIANYFVKYVGKVD